MKHLAFGTALLLAAAPAHAELPLPDVPEESPSDEENED